MTQPLPSSPVDILTELTGGWQARKQAEEHSGAMPPFLVAGSLQPFISEDLRTLVPNQNNHSPALWRQAGAGVCDQGELI